MLCSGAVNLATKFRGSFHSIQRRRLSNTVSLLKAPSGVVGTLSEYLRSFVASSSGGRIVAVWRVEEMRRRMLVTCTTWPA